MATYRRAQNSMQFIDRDRVTFDYVSQTMTSSNRAMAKHFTTLRIVTEARRTEAAVQILSSTLIQTRSDRVKLLFNVYKIADAILKIKGNMVLKKAKQNAPVETGALRNSLKLAKKGLLLWEISSDLDYANYVEFGTSYSAAHPFLRPALNR